MVPATASGAGFAVQICSGHRLLDVLKMKCFVQAAVKHGFGETENGFVDLSGLSS